MRPDRPHHLTSGRVSDTRTIIPHARGRGAREGRGPSRKPASCSHGAPRPPPARLSRIAERCAAAARGPAEPARSRFADGLSVEVQLFKAAPLRDNALRGKLPQRDQKLSRDSNDRYPPDAPGPNERGKPAADR